MTADAIEKTINGVVIGVFMGFAEGGEPLVVFPGNRSKQAIAAKSTAALGADDVGREVALMFENGDPDQPLIVGRIVKPGSQDDVPLAPNKDHLELRADQDITLRCGKASLTLTRAGKILLRGAYIFSRSTGVNKIKGGSVQLN